ncbi:MAG: alpha/beta hydrolase, partial [Ignavibacteriales bacterium]|nr:alpha/beta hydrolase [Ignavibacteriales bacterium]
MKKVISKDGTPIIYDQLGKGQPIILIDGALCYRSFGPMSKLAPLLAEHFTVIYYDRRGRGDSGDTVPYAVEREIEDLKALIDALGGSVYVYGISSGAALALLAAGKLNIKKLALYEPPFLVDNSLPPDPEDYLDQLADLLASDRRGDMVKLFMKTVGVPRIFIAVMQFMPMWSKLKAVAHTLIYDFTILGDTRSGKPLPNELTGMINSIKVPTLMMVGGKSPQWMHLAVQTVT